MEVLRIEIEGITTSFRYPHFVQGVHPTLDAPPPATVYGHVCSTVGQLLSPETLAFGYSFVHEGKFEDLEHLHFGGQINPFRRQLLFNPHLTLYLAADELAVLERAFLSPHYAVVLGRSQDLMTYSDVRVLTLEPASEAYFEGTLLPEGGAPFVEGSTTTIIMARYIDAKRKPSWERYALLRGRGRFPRPNALLPRDVPETVWVDPTVRDWVDYPELRRAVWLHRFVPNTNEPAG